MELKRGHPVHLQGRELSCTNLLENHAYSFLIDIHRLSSYLLELDLMLFGDSIGAIMPSPLYSLISLSNSLRATARSLPKKRILFVDYSTL